MLMVKNTSACLQGSTKILAVRDKTSSTVSKHVDHEKVGIFDPKDEADVAGEMVFITLLASGDFIFVPAGS